MDGIELNEHDKDLIRRRVESGDYQSASGVIRAGLQLLEEQDAPNETWLREITTARMDEFEQHPERAIPVERVLPTSKLGTRRGFQKKPDNELQRRAPPPRDTVNQSVNPQPQPPPRPANQAAASIFSSRLFGT
jgi:antitoxin ParD1/3/4